MSVKSSSRVQFYLLVALFFGPLLVATWVYFGTSLRPSGQTHHGNLLDPVRPLPAATQWLTPEGDVAKDLSGDLWTLLQFVPDPCEEACQNDLYRSRQVWLALDRRRVRVQRIAVVTNAAEAEALAEIAEDVDPNLKLRVVERCKVCEHRCLQARLLGILRPTPSQPLHLRRQCSSLLPLRNRQRSTPWPPSHLIPSHTRWPHRRAGPGMVQPPLSRTGSRSSTHMDLLRPLLVYRLLLRRRKRRCRPCPTPMR